ncbi:hypothetical protein AB0953_27795 [Streptomyces sp. NPDC046866]|uniref:hypothetical protein n=1 Tax=Streptomyces sp. NPDC046866 TaxID=3154921 RepID=UPI003451E7A4
MSAHEILRRMEEIQAARAAAIEPLAEIQGKRADLLQQLADLDEPYGKAYADAEAAGWSTDELTAIGAEEPAKRPKGRPRTRRAAVRKATAEAAPSTLETPSPTATVPAQGASGSPAPVATGSQSR